MVAASVIEGPLVFAPSGDTAAASAEEVVPSAEFGAAPAEVHAAASAATVASVVATAVDVAERQSANGRSYGPAVSRLVKRV
jgi:hypothetical protein